MTRYRTPRLTAAVLLCATALAFTEWRPRASGTISGVVFEDFNGNGLRDTTTTITNIGAGTVSTAVDRGVGGVTVTVFDGAGVVQGTASSSPANGSYSIAAAGVGPYRVEFTTLPAGYFPSRFAAGAAGNGTTVQFVPDGNTADINLAILDPASFCENNPTFAVSCYVFGDQLIGPNATLPVVVDFPYSAGASGPGSGAYFEPSTHPLMVQAQSVGSTYGLAYRQGTTTLYTSAFMKKHTGFGSGGTGAIYTIDPTAFPGGAPSLFATVPNAGADPHDPTDYNVDNGNTSWDAVGKRSLGGLEVSPDGAFLYAVNLFDRQVYKIPTAGGPPTSAPVPVPASAVPASGADIRPFALQYYKGLLYVGMVNSAETTQDAANLRAYVYSLNPASMAFSASPVAEFSLQFPRGYVQNFDGLSPGDWLPWRTTFATNRTGGPSSRNIGTYPQPMLTGLSFDVDGNLTFGFRDRAGDQFGYFTFDNPANLSQLWEGVASGDTLFAEINVKGDLASGWSLESNAQTPTFGPTGGANNLEGPGGGEYFFQDVYFDPLAIQIFHEEITAGAVLQVPGFPDVMTSSMNPGLTTNAGGLMWLSRLAGATEGTKTKGYNLYATPEGPPSTFSKANGLGEFVVMCQAAPIEIGNRVWNDVNGNGVQDANEPGLDGVTVQLIAPGGGAAIATVVTANGGQYYFSSTTIAGLTPNTTGYIVRLDATQGALGGRNLTIANSDGSANGDSRDSDASLTAGNAEIVVTTGAAGNNNHTYDFGFTTAIPPPLSLGDFVWYDTNNNGIVDAGEQPITGVDVVLYRDNGNNTFDALTDALVAAQQTAGGLYLFTGLTPGNYFVQIPQIEFTAGQTLVGYQNSTGQTVGDVNNVDHGAPAPVAGQGIVSDLVTLTLFGEPINDGDTDNNTNLTIDFGFYKLSLGNFVFFDTNNNGVVDAGELPAAGVPVELLNSANTVLQTTATDAFGIYGFAGLTPGDYSVRITPPTGYTSSTGAGNAFEPGPDPDNNVDNDDNGTNTGGPIVSPAITLTPGAEPIVTNANGETSNPTVDFGLIPPIGMSLGNLVWLDANNDGIAQPTETGINGVTVRLFNGNGTVQLATQQTAGGGFYLFTNLAAGDYVVEVVIPTGLVSSTGAGNAYEPAPDPDNNINNDDNGTTQTGGVVVRSLPVTLALNTEPVDDGDTDQNSNLTVDFGFFSTPTLCLGNLVWFDLNNNGVVNPGETGIPGVTMRLIGADGVTVIATTVTDANGNYLFCGLPEGIYYVEVDRTSSSTTGLSSSTDIATSGNPDNDTDNDDNGVNITTTTVRSNAVTLVFNTEPDTPVDGDGTNSNLTVDFGFVPLLSLGNLVWADDDDDALVDANELGIAGIAVRLIAANGTTLLASTTTNGNGNYLFAGLQPGTYFVEITALVVGLGDQSSSTDIASSADPNNDRDNDDNGIGVGFGNGTTGIVVRSAAVTLTLGGEPVNDGDTNPNSNLTVDFGIPGGGPPEFAQAFCRSESIPRSIIAGVPFTATFASENRGPGRAKDLRIDGMLPAGLNVVSTAPSPGGTCTNTSSMIDCTWPGQTAVGAAADRFVVATLRTDANIPDGTTIQLWFMTSTANPPPGIVIENERSSQCDGYPFVVSADGPKADLAITATASSASQSGTSVAGGVNQPVRARFTVTNNGSMPARGLYEIFLDGARGLDLTSASVSQGSTQAAGATSGTWETAPIAPGGTATLDLTFVPRSDAVTKVTALRTRGTPADDNSSNDTASFVIDGVGSGGGRFVAAGNVDGIAGDEIITGVGIGEAAQVRIFSGAGAPMQSFYAFVSSFLGGVRVASCDINGDGRDEIVAATGPGGGRVRVVTLVGGIVTEVVVFDAFENSFTGGVNVACADVDADGLAEVVVAPDGGRAPTVRVFDVGVKSAVIAAQFQAYEASFTGGVRVAAAPFAGSGLVGAFQIATTPGPGRAGDVRAWAVGGGTATLVAGAVVAPPSGARVALGDADGNGVVDLLVMPDGGVSALISIYSLQTGAAIFSAPPGAAGFRSLDATVGTLAGGPGVPEVVVGRGPGQSPDIVSFRVMSGGAIVPRLFFSALEVP